MLLESAVSQYNNPNYWENLILKNHNFWKESFLNLPINKESIFINTVMIDYGKDVLENNWAVYNTAKAVLGFLQYIYIPTAFFFVLNDRQDIYIPLGVSEDMGYEFRETFHKSNHIDVMEMFINEINTYWELSEEQCKIKLKKFCLKFNNYWKDSHKELCIRLFFNVNEIEEYIFDGELSEFPEVIEEEIGLTRKEFCEKFYNIYGNELMKRIFLNFLNEIVL